VLKHGTDERRARLTQFITLNLLEHSQHKFASNVVEKCLQFASKAERFNMVQQVLRPLDGKPVATTADADLHCALDVMIGDPYANYVVQKLFEVRHLAVCVCAVSECVAAF
jgi:pumilio RNA-binding family|tara:strand:+ start:2047 stop:2379 length:333 start_codon:yes stop_codon:yes gene_type:complete